MVDYASSIKTLQLNSATQVVVPGGSSGIGRSVAIQYAALGCSVLIIGRTRSAGEATLAEMERVARPDAHAKLNFIQADLSVVKGMHQAVDAIREWSGEQGVQYLIQTQGVAPVDQPLPTSDGHEIFFAIQALSRFALCHLLFSTGVLQPTATVFHIGIAGFGAAYVLQADDIELANADKGAGGNIGFMKRGANTCAVIDCFTKDLSIRQPQARFVHMWPGVVKTDVMSRSNNSPWYFRGLAHIVHFMGLAVSPDDFAAIVIYAASALPKEDEVFKALCLNEKARPIPVSTAAEDKAVREKVWARLEEMIRI